MKRQKRVSLPALGRDRKSEGKADNRIIEKKGKWKRSLKRVMEKKRRREVEESKAVEKEGRKGETEKRRRGKS